MQQLLIWPLCFHPYFTQFFLFLINIAAKIIMVRHRGQSIPYLKNVQWFFISHRRKAKVFTMFYAALHGLASGYCFDLIIHYFLFGSFQYSHIWLLGSSDMLNLLPLQDLCTCCSFYSNNHSPRDLISSSFTLFRTLIKYQPITITLHPLPYSTFP